MRGTPFILGEEGEGSGIGDREYLSCGQTANVAAVDTQDSVEPQTEPHPEF